MPLVLDVVVCEIVFDTVLLVAVVSAEVDHCWLFEDVSVQLALSTMLSVALREIEMLREALLDVENEKVGELDCDMEPDFVAVHDFVIDRDNDNEAECCVADIASEALAE